MNFNNAVFEAAAGKAGQLLPTNLPEIVFSGRSNVGKSSLINKLCNRKALARVSATPGKTGTINFYKLPEVRLVDLPGYGYAKVSFSEKRRWAELVEGYFNAERNIKLVVQIVDFRHPPTKDDMDMIRYLYDCGFPYLIVLTKSDKLNKTQRTSRLELLKSELEGFEAIERIPFSSVTGEGLDTIQQRIAACAEEEIGGDKAKLQKEF